jgi:hypothetical protein
MPRDRLTEAVGKVLRFTRERFVMGWVRGLRSTLAVMTRLMGYLLYQVGPRDPAAFGSAFLVIAIAGLGACSAQNRERTPCLTVFGPAAARFSAASVGW